MTPLQIRHAALAAAALSVLASALYFRLFGLLPQLPNRLGLMLGLIATLAALAALGLVQRLATKRSLRLSDPARHAVETLLGGLAFLYALYHLSHALRLAAPVAVALDALIPAPILDLFGLLPGLAAALLAELIWRRPPLPKAARRKTAAVPSAADTAPAGDRPHPPSWLKSRRGLRAADRPPASAKQGKPNGPI